MGQEEEQQPRSRRQEPYEEALRAVHQRALDTAKALQGDIECIGETEIDQKLTPEPTAEVTVEVVLEAEVGAAVGLAVRVTPEAAPRVGGHGPLMGLHLREG